MNSKRFFRPRLIATALILVGFTAASQKALAYPPAVGILGPSKNCLACHANNGPWQDDSILIIDVLDKTTGQSLRQADSSFLIAAARGETRTVLTVIGTRKDSLAPAPYRNAWLYVDPARIADTYALSKFAPGWQVNLPMSCRIVGDRLEAYPDAHLTVLPMTVRAGDDARDAELELQVMLTKGESVKGKAKEGMLGNYFRRTVRLHVLGSTPAPSPTESPAKPKQGQQDARPPLPKTGDPAPDFSLQDFQDKRFMLSQLKNRKVVLLWFSNLCEGCLAKMGKMERIKRLFEKKPVEIVAVSVLVEDRETVSKVIQDNKLTFRFLYDPKGEAVELYGGRPIPNTCPMQNLFIIQLDGRIAYVGRYPGADEAKIADQLQRAVGGAPR